MGAALGMMAAKKGLDAAFGNGGGGGEQQQDPGSLLGQGGQKPLPTQPQDNFESPLLRALQSQAMAAMSPNGTEGPVDAPVTLPKRTSLLDLFQG